MKLTNVGRGPTTLAFQIEGETDLPNQTSTLYFWQNGGSLLDKSTATAVRIERQRAFTLPSMTWGSWSARMVKSPPKPTAPKAPMAWPTASWRRIAVGAHLGTSVAATKLNPRPVGPRYRQVFISDYTYFQRNALAYTKTAAFQEDMKLRPHVERIIAAVTRYNGTQRSPGRAEAYGLDNADFQLKMCAMAYNLKRWHTLTKEREKAQRYKPPDPAA